MLPLLLFVISSVAFAQVLRYVLEHGLDLWTVAAVNYAFAAAAALALLSMGRPAADWTDWGSVCAAGAFNGVLYFSHLPFLISAYRAAGVGVTTAVNRSSIAVPALIAWCVWQEPMGPARWCALGLLPVGMYLVRPSRRDVGRHGLKIDAALPVCFVIAAAIFTIHKYADVRFSAGQREVYKAALFAGAAVASAGYAVCRRGELTWRQVRVGFVLGGCNVVSLAFIMWGLAVLPAVILYPTSGCLSIILTTVVSRLLWDERPVGRQLAGLGVAVVVVVLTNL